MWFSSAGVTLFMNLQFLRKVYTKANASRPIHVSAIHNQSDRALCKLCVHWTLNVYVRHSGDYRQDGTVQLFVAYGGPVRGKPISKQQLSNSLVECIKFAYTNTAFPHQTLKMAFTYADMAGADPQPFARLQPGGILTPSPGSISLTSSPTLMQSLAGEF